MSKNRTCMRDDVVEHLRFIQAIIARHGNNSFLLKGWTVTLAAAILGLAASNPNPLLGLIALIPALAFWALDAYYLRQERIYRTLYDRVRLNANKPVEPGELFSLSANQSMHEVPSWFRTLWASSVVGLHGVLVVTILIVTTRLAGIW